MIRTLLLVCGTVLLFGALQASPDFLRDRGTLSLSAAESVVFLGITGDYREVSAEDLAIRLAGEEDIAFVGESIGAMGDRSRRVWAIRTDEPKKVSKKLDKPLNKLGFKATQLQLSVVQPLQNDAKAMRTASRTIEDDTQVWAVWADRRGPGVWIFHESKLSGKKIEGMFRKTEAKVAFYHQEFEFSTNDGADLPTLTTAAKEKLDSLKVSVREERLVLDLFLRDIDSMLLLENEKGTKQFLCPDIVHPFLGTSAAASLDWAVTLENDGFPFVN
ncbi:MAG: hypothetical protein O3A95_03575 [Planctomycetota bacterium]|nr:hypothetical protein [Planctomycetota bacterium]MDA1113361.1 hypothetical protein [Planctomycetota bacterium]